MLTNHRQYTLPIIQAPNFTEYSYFVNEGNEEAYSLIESWGDWSFLMCVVYGPEGYGKTHLAHILKDRTEGELVLASEVSDQLITSLKSGRLYLVEDVCKMTSPEVLFHFYNVAKERGSLVVFFMSMAPAAWESGLADLNSRLRSLPAFELKQPDDAMCRAIIKKILSDLQLTVKEEVIDYFQDHTSRNLGEIQKNIHQLNRVSLEQRRNITIPFVKQVLNVGG